MDERKRNLDPLTVEEKMAVRTLEGLILKTPKVDAKVDAWKALKTLHASMLELAGRSRPTVPGKDESEEWIDG